MTFTLGRRPTFRQREKQALKRLGFGWFLAIGPTDDVLVVVAVRDGGQADTARREAARIRAKLTNEGRYELAALPSTVRLAMCLPSMRAAANVRRAVLSKLAPGRLGGELLEVGADLVERAAREEIAAARLSLIDAAERSRRLEAEMMRV